MKTVRLIRNAVYTITVAAWLWLCWAFWRQLVSEAGDSGEIYARTPRFQALNFVVQYLWFFLLLLAAALLVEWLLFWAAGRLALRRAGHAA